MAKVYIFAGTAATAMKIADNCELHRLAFGVVFDATHARGLPDRSRLMVCSHTAKFHKDYATVLEVARTRRFQITYYDMNATGSAPTSTEAEDF